MNRLERRMLVIAEMQANGGIIGCPNLGDYGRRCKAECKLCKGQQRVVCCDLCEGCGMVAGNICPKCHSNGVLPYVENDCDEWGEKRDDNSNRTKCESNRRQL